MVHIPVSVFTLNPRCLMPAVITKTVYTFAELIEARKAGKVNDRAVSQARQWLQEGATDHDWFDYTVGEWKKALEYIGFLNAEINFSGFWSQGDGASFTASVDLERLLRFMSNPPGGKQQLDTDKDGNYVWGPWLVWKAEGVRSNKKFSSVLLRVDDRCYLKVIRNSHQYSHERTCGLEDECNVTSKMTKALWKEFVESVEELRVDLCHAIYKDLEKEHEYLNSDEQLAESSDANDYTFDETGHRDDGIRESATTRGKLGELVDRVAEAQGTDQRGALRDIITEAQHLAEENGWDWDHLLAGAQEVFDEETEQ